eukprot:SAG31_NODE_633_length_13382_cov_11.528911_7_plen_809_part_00
MGSILHRRSAHASTGLQAKTQKLVEEARRGAARHHAAVSDATPSSSGPTIRKYATSPSTSKWSSQTHHKKSGTYTVSGTSPESIGNAALKPAQPVMHAGQTSALSSGLKGSSRGLINLAGGAAAASSSSRAAGRGTAVTGQHQSQAPHQSTAWSSASQQQQHPHRVVRRTAEQKALSPERLNLDNQHLIACPILQGEERLRLLNYQSNSISRMQNLRGLPNLIFLDLYNNKIERIENIDTLNGLRVLMLGKNQIQNIEGLEACTKLDVLDLHSNRISDIAHAALNQLRSLRVLNLAGNQIHGALQTASFDGLISLTELNLRRNKIATLEPTVGSSLLSLQRLFLSHNQIESSAGDSLVESLSTMPQLLELSLEHNGVCALPFYRQTIVDNVRKLQTLDSKSIVAEERRLSAFVCKEQNAGSQAGGELTTVRRQNQHSFLSGVESGSACSLVGSDDDATHLNGSDSQSRDSSSSAEGHASKETLDTGHDSSRDESVRVAKIRAVLWDWQTGQITDSPSADAPNAAAGFSEVEDNQLYIYGVFALDSLSRALKPRVQNAAGSSIVNSATGRQSNLHRPAMITSGGPAPASSREDTIKGVAIKFVSFETLIETKVFDQIQAVPGIMSVTLAHNHLRTLSQIDELADLCASRVGLADQFELNISDNPICNLGLFRSYCIYKLSPGCAILNGLAIAADEQAAALKGFRLYDDFSKKSTFPAMLVQRDTPRSSALLSRTEGRNAGTNESGPPNVKGVSTYVDSITKSALIVEQKIYAINTLWPRVVRDAITSTLNELDNADTLMAEKILDKYLV